MKPLSAEALVAYLTRHPIARQDSPSWSNDNNAVRVFYERVFRHLPPSSAGAEAALLHLIRLTSNTPLPLPELSFPKGGVQFTWASAADFVVYTDGRVVATIRGSDRPASLQGV